MFQLCIQTRNLQSWWKDEKRESLMFIIKSLNITIKRWLSHALMISVLINVSEEMHEAHCFIDSEIERNFILQSWVKEHKLSKNHAILKQIQTINDHWIFCYDIKLITSSWVIEIELNSQLVKTWFKSEFWNWVFKLSQSFEIKYSSWVIMLISSIDSNSWLNSLKHEANIYLIMQQSNAINLITS